MEFPIILIGRLFFKRSRLIFQIGHRFLEGSNWTRGGGKTTTTGVSLTAIGVKFFAAGVKRGHGGVRFLTTVAVRVHRFYAAPVQPQKQTRDSSGT